MNPPPLKMIQLLRREDVKRDELEKPEEPKERVYTIEPDNSVSLRDDEQVQSQIPVAEIAVQDEVMGLLSDLKGELSALKDEQQVVSSTDSGEIKTLFAELKGELKDEFSALITEQEATIERRWWRNSRPSW